MTPLPYPVIDVTSRKQSLDELSMPLNERRATARSGGELWAAIILTAVPPFLNSEAELATVLVLNSTDDKKVAEFVDIAKTQHLTKEAKVIEMIGSEIDAIMQAHRLGFAAGANVAEITVRMIDRFSRAYAAVEQATSSLHNAPDFEDEDGAWALTEQFIRNNA